MADSSGIEADYVVIGAGAAAMAFVDTILSETGATVAMVDRRNQPGGHWNDAYPFVRLHSASTFYGVNSLPLGGDRVETEGLNRGHLEVAGAAEICGYFDRVMRCRFLPSGRMTFLPSHEYFPDGRAISFVTGRSTRLVAKRRVVDATNADTRVPALSPPAFPVATTATCITPGELARRDLRNSQFVVIGAGKTAIDVVLWLLAQQVEPEAITWIRPRDCWLYNRRHQQPRSDLAESNLEGWVAEMEAARESSSLADLYDRLERARVLMRIDPSAQPTMFHCATVTEAELEELRRVKKVVRLGRVRAIDERRIVLDGGDIPASSNCVHIHCAASGVPVRPIQPVFQDGRIVLQFVQHCWPLFSAAMIGYLEARRDDDETRNRLAQPIPMADKPCDWLRGRILDDQNSSAWENEPDIEAWRARARIDGFSGMLAAARRNPTPRFRELIDRLEEARTPGLERMQALLSTA
jgi:hypothetical protein